MRDQITIANTIAFSPDGTRLYTADTATGDLGAWHFDQHSGALGERDVSFRVAPNAANRAGFSIGHKGLLPDFGSVFVAEAKSI